MSALKRLCVQNWIVRTTGVWLWVLLTVISYWLLVLPRQQRFDFYPRWVGSRAVLAGENPYTQEITWRIQEGMFGERLEPGADEQRFAYPATVAWILLPFWLLPFPASVSLWCGLQFLVLLTLPLAIVTLLGWRIRPLRLVILLVCSSLVYRYPINAYLLGQFIPFVLACLVGAWWGLVNDRLLATVLLLVGMTARPELAVLPTLIFCVTAWREGKRWAIGLWAGLVGCLWLLTRLWIGPWVLDFLGGVRSYSAYSFPHWPPLMVGNGWIAWLVTIGVLAWGWWMLAQVWRLPTASRLPWEISVAVLVTLIVLPQTNNYTLVLGLAPAWVVLWAGRERWSDWAPALAILASPWFFYAARDSLPMELEQLLIPLAWGVLLTQRWLAWRQREMSRNPSYGVGDAESRK